MSTQLRRLTINTRLEKCSGHGKVISKPKNANPRVNEFANSPLRTYGVQRKFWDARVSLGPKNEISHRNKLTLFDVRKDQTTQRMYASCTKLRQRKNSRNVAKW